MAENRLEEVKKFRKEKLNNIIKSGANPFPSKGKEGREEIGKVLDKKTDEKTLISGRIRALRSHGSLTFVDLEDITGKIQCVFKDEVLTQEEFAFLDNLDMGDILEVWGKTFETKTKQFSVLAEGYTILTKSLHPLPDKWHGLKDLEERSRRRYVDLMVNKESRDTFITRSKIIEAHREYLTELGYIEVETPILQPIYGGGLARPFKTYHNVLDIPLYLRISSELYLKRLIVGGFEKVFEIGHVFRNEGIDKNHNPEFTILETMQAYINYKDNMKILEEMTEYVVKEVTGGTLVEFSGHTIDFKTPWKRQTMVEAVKEVTGVDFTNIDSLDRAQELAREHEIHLESHQQSVGVILSAFFEEKVEETLIQPTIIYNHPIETSPLAKQCEDDSRFVERFEHYVAGMECSNNYSELNDPVELSKRLRDERKKEKLGDTEAHQMDMDFIEALEYGMPPTSGLGPGIDRLVMIVTGNTHLRDIILFPTLKPRDGVTDDGVRGDMETKEN